MGVLDGKAAIVTGSARGIGRATAEVLAEHGARVLINDLDGDVAEQAATEIPGDTAVFSGDLTKEGICDQLVQKAMDEFGQLDIVVNNAGYTWDSVIQKMTDEQWQAVMDVHVTAPFRILRAAAEPIRKFAKAESAEGREVYRKVVNISSVSGLGGNAGQVNYASGKAAVVGMTKTLAKEWGRYRVNVNCVAFGFIRTRMTQPLGDANAPVEVAGRKVAFGVQSALLDQLEKQQIPLGRLGTVEEAAGGVYLFCIPESDYVSGQVITVGGGIRF